MDQIGKQGKEEGWTRLESKEKRKDGLDWKASATTCNTLVKEIL